MAAPVSLGVLVCEVGILHASGKGCPEDGAPAMDALHKRHLLGPCPLPDLTFSFWTKEQIWVTTPLVLSPGLKLALGALQREATQGEPLASAW